MKVKQIIYDVCIMLLASTSIALVLLDYSNFISIEDKPYFYLDKAILVIFMIDYFVRCYLSKNKWLFFKSNIFDLLAIIPLDSILSLFRFSRLFRLSKVMRLSKIFRLFRLVGVVGKLEKNAKIFFNTNGFGNLLKGALSILVIGSLIYSSSENVPFTKSLWWAITTATTVGYGDMSPATDTGKIVAVILMILGVGVIGMLTSTITSFFMHNEEQSNDELNKKIDNLSNEINELKKIIKSNNQNK